MSFAELNDAVESARKEILSLMKARGYTQKTTRQSALYQTDFVKGGKTAFVIDGWHGSGKRGTCRWFGDGKTIFALYDVRQEGSAGRVKVALDSKYYHEEEIQNNVGAQKEVIAKIIAYLKANA